MPAPRDEQRDGAQPQQQLGAEQQRLDVHAVVPAGRLDETIDAYVKELLGASPTAIAAAKRLIPQVWGRSPADARDLTADAIASQRASPEGQDGLRAFLEKRAPGWATTR